MTDTVTRHTKGTGTTTEPVPEATCILTPVRGRDADARYAPPGCRMTMLATAISP
jgi:hypothetical protein